MLIHKSFHCKLNELDLILSPILLVKDSFQENQPGLSGSNLSIGTRQLDFLDDWQCRLNFLDNMRKEARARVPIFDTTQK